MTRGFDRSEADYRAYLPQRKQPTEPEKVMCPVCGTPQEINQYGRVQQHETWQLSAMVSQGHNRWCRGSLKKADQ